MTKGWTEERRQKQAERIRQNRPWEKSTGPRSAAGKARSRNNSRKHGLYDYQTREMRAALKLQRESLKALIKAFKLQYGYNEIWNELKKNSAKSKRQGGGGADF
jgi:hypothetical protein